MTFEYILKKSIGDKPHCYDGPDMASRAQSAIENMSTAPEYAEPGYDNPRKHILFANWNYLSRRAADLLERYGYAIEWSDEWLTCSDCGRAVRCVENSYSWLPSYVLFHECEPTCFDCIDWPEYLKSIEDKPTHACMASIDPGQYGYDLISRPGEFENGFHPGQTDRPADILTKLRKDGSRGYLFRISGKGQFDMDFEVWQRTGEDHA